MREAILPPILVTGGAGFIGSHLVDALLARGERVVCLDNFDDYYDPAQKQYNVAEHCRHSAYSLVVGDVRDREAIFRLFGEHRFRRVVHLAALAGVRYSIERAALYSEVNVQGAIHLMDAARHFGAENFVLASTSSVYGATQGIPFRENDPCDRPLAPYPATKRAAEIMAHAFHNMFGLNVTVLRFFTVYGPRVRPDMMAYSVIDDILHDREITVFNNGDLHRDWTFVDDVIQGVVAAVDRPLGYEVMNIGRGQPVRLGDFVDTIEGLIGRKARVQSAPAPASEPPITYASVEKASQLLGYQPRTSIQEGLAKTWAWYQAYHHL